MPDIIDEIGDHAEEMGCEVCGAFFNATLANLDNGHDCARSRAALAAEVGA